MFALHERKIRQPVVRGIAKVPVVMQMEALECGAACLTMVLAYYGKWVPLEQVRMDCGVSRDGSNAKNIAKAAQGYGLVVKGFKSDAGAIRENGIFPCVIHWNFNHFVVLCGFRGNRACINDPARGSVRVSMEEFDKAFTGVCLMFSPGEAFQPDGKRKSTLAFARKRLSGAGAAVAFVMLTSVISYVFTMVNPAFSRFFMDRLLTGENRELLLPFIGLLTAVSITQIIVAAVQATYTLKIHGKMAVIGSSTFLWKVLRLPMSFFSQRMAGDIQTRHRDNAVIAGTLVNTLSPLVLSAGMMVFYLVVMLRYSPLLTLAGLISVALNVSMSRLISQKRVNITRVQLRDKGKLAASTVSGIQIVETIKASGAETGYFQKWAGYQASVNVQETKFTRLNQYLGMIPAFVSTLANAVVLVLGVWLCMRGQFTLGMVAAFQSFLASFLNPAQTLITAGQTIQEMRTQMERVEDVMEYPDDALFASNTAAGEPDYEKLSGEVLIDKITFGYSRLDQPLIENFRAVQLGYSR